MVKTPRDSGTFYRHPHVLAWTTNVAVLTAGSGVLRETVFS